MSDGWRRWTIRFTGLPPPGMWNARRWNSAWISLMCIG